MHKGDHASTFAGGPYTTHVARHVVSRIAEPAFLAAVEEKGQLLRDLLEELNSPHVLEVRGKGLMVGAELDIETGPLIGKAAERGLLVINAGPNVLRFVPPRCQPRRISAVAIIGESCRSCRTGSRHADHPPSRPR